MLGKDLVLFKTLLAEREQMAGDFSAGVIYDLHSFGEYESIIKAIYYGAYLGTMRERKRCLIKWKKRTAKRKYRL